MAWLNSLSIRSRLYFSTVFSLVLMLAVGGLGFWALDSTRSTVKDLVDDKVHNLAQVNTLRIMLAQVRLQEKDIIISFNNAVEVAELRTGWLKALAAFRQGVTALHTSDDLVYATAAKTVLVEIKAYADGLSPVLEKIEGAQIDGAVGGAYAGQLKGHVEAIDKVLRETAAVSQQQMQTAQTDIDTRVLWLATLQAGLLGLALLVLIPLTLYTVRGITRALAQARHVAESIAQGQLYTSVAGHTDDEIGQLVATMGRMQDFLRNLVAGVQSAAQGIDLTAGEIAAGNQDLSHRTEHTAANLEETVVSMTELSGNVMHSAASAAQANDMVSTTAEVATRGGALVSEVVVTMNEINSSSKKIADIIGVIDGIAFQTNILALNAAVEAARAGEQGRGFAVVATEVRQLAQRSATAAKEISVLIGASVRKAREGAQLVANAGTTMEDIVGSVRRVRGVIGELSVQASTQSRGLSQISESVAQLDQVTQQNAALVEQSAAASESLRAQANVLTRAISVFKLERVGV
jgi:methyl-accepting chemotaxis protein